ncbi:hypothetical protein KAR28_04820 [Candidatus Parcubacteria bacterium]|nr:hypothetical protein [Candidatus Parcubacteria bacterium]
MRISRISKLCILIMLAVLLVNCGNPADTNIGKISKGMSEFEVLDIMGVPDKARTDFKAMSMGPIGTSKVFMYKGSKGWHRVVIFGGVVFTESGVDGSEDPQFPVNLEIVPLGPGEFEFKIGGIAK